MIKFKKVDNLLLLSYDSNHGTKWLELKMKEYGRYALQRTFAFLKSDIYQYEKYEDDEELNFVVAKIEGNYYRFDKDILQIERDVYIHKDIEIDVKFFITNNTISVFRKIDELLSDDEVEIRIGKSENDNLPLDIFVDILGSLPKYGELRNYARMRVDTIVKDYLETKKDYSAHYHRYMDKKPSKVDFDVYDYFDEYETDKYKKILQKLKYMLKDEEKYTEKQWQKEILQIIRLIYPKYIAVFENVKIRDVYKPTNRFLDFMLIDANGNIDLVEIKKPFGKKGMVTSSVYRDNHVPVRELSGSIMQIEKYIYYLNKWGKTGEDELTKRYASKLPKDFKIKVTTPHALIIMGRDGSMNAKQQEDFEIIKRKYKNVADILTYDDLIKRLENTIEMYGKEVILNEDK